MFYILYVINTLNVNNVEETLHIVDLHEKGKKRNCIGE